MNLSFGVLDWIVFGAMVAISLAIAIINFFVSRKKGASVDEFLMGSRELPVIPATLSYVASFVSSITVIGYPAEVYVSGVTFLFAPVLSPIGGLIVLSLVVPMFYPLKLNSIFEYFEFRYNSRFLRIVVMLISMLFDVTFVGMCIFGTCVVIETMVGLNIWKGILIVGILGTVPAVIGGLKGVIWMDFFQAIIMLISLFAILIAGSLSLGGFTNALNIFTTQHYKLNASLDHTKVDLWGVLLGNMLIWVRSCGFSQAGLQRYGAVRSIRKAYFIVGMGVIIQLGMWVLSGFCGIIVYSFYAGRGCDPITSGTVGNVNGLMADLVQRVLNYPAVPGLFLASIVSANYSSVTSSQTAIAANLWEDIIKGRVGNLSPLKQIVIVRSLVAVTGAVGIAIAFICSVVEGSLMRIFYAFMGSISGTISGVFLLSAGIPWTNTIGCFTGGIASMALTLWMSIGGIIHVGRDVEQPPVANMTCPLDGFNTTRTVYDMQAISPSAPAQVADGNIMYQLYATHPIWYNVIAVGACIVIGSFVSLITMKCFPPISVENKYLFKTAKCCRKGSPSKMENYRYSKAPRDESTTL